MLTYSIVTTSTSRQPVGLRKRTRSPPRAFNRARANGDTQLIRLRGEIGLVDPDDLIRLLGTLLVAYGYSRTKKDLIGISLSRRIDDLSQIRPPGQETDAPVNLAQAPLAVDVVAVLRPIAVRRRPMHNLDDMRPLDAQQMIQLIRCARRPWA